MSCPSSRVSSSSVSPRRARWATCSTSARDRVAMRPMIPGHGRSRTDPPDGRRRHRARRRRDHRRRLGRPARRGSSSRSPAGCRPVRRRASTATIVGHRRRDGQRSGRLGRHDLGGARAARAGPRTSVDPGHDRRGSRRPAAGPSCSWPPTRGRRSLRAHGVRASRPSTGRGGPGPRRHAAPTPRDCRVDRTGAAGIPSASTADLPAMVALDRAATGEDRAHLIERFASPGTTRVVDRRRSRRRLRHPRAVGRRRDDRARTPMTPSPSCGPDRSWPEPDDRPGGRPRRERRPGSSASRAAGWTEAWRAPRLIRGEPLDWQTDRDLGPVQPRPRLTGGVVHPVDIVTDRLVPDRDRWPDDPTTVATAIIRDVPRRAARHDATSASSAGPRPSASMSPSAAAAASPTATPPRADAELPELPGLLRDRRRRRPPAEPRPAGPAGRPPAPGIEHDRHPVGDDEWLETLREGDRLRWGRWTAPFDVVRRYLVTGQVDAGPQPPARPRRDRDRDDPAPPLGSRRRDLRRPARMGGRADRGQRADGALRGRRR